MDGECKEEEGEEEDVGSGAVCQERHVSTLTGRLERFHRPDRPACGRANCRAVVVVEVGVVVGQRRLLQGRRAGTQQPLTDTSGGRG